MRDVVSYSGLSICREARHPGVVSTGCDRDRVVPPLRASGGLKAPVTIDEILEALCALDDGPRQLHAGVAIIGPRSAALFYDLSKLPSDPR